MQNALMLMEMAWVFGLVIIAGTWGLATYRPVYIREEKPIEGGKL